MNEFINYVRSEPGLDRLVRALLERYIQLGRIGGSVRLTNLTTAEKESLSLFFRKDYGHQASATISFKAFEKALLQTKFSGLSTHDILSEYAGEKVYTRIESEEHHQRQKDRYFESLKTSHPDQADWIDYIWKKGRGTRAIHQLYDENPGGLAETIDYVCRALSNLPSPQQYERLPLFAQKITQNPHAFDLDQHGGRILLHALQFRLWKEDVLPYIQGTLNSEEANELFQTFGLLRDDILNFVTCTGLKGETRYGEHAVLQAAQQMKTVLNLPLREVSRLTSCQPFSGNTVFIVENSGVYSELLDRWPFHEPPPLLCTHGQFKLAALTLIDLLVAGDTFIYYSGDFDPEGLLMAARLMNRAPDRVHPWRFSAEDYAGCQSNVTLSKDRLAKLEKVDLFPLLPAKRAILKTKKAGYQEKLVDSLLKDMKKILL
ncbi:TIGR02679 family protein [Siminovitchia sp. 179-K 8D1 HS]|uniref:TIGR02679 family protein n=1 Tax=Siminovitchia sp. 179-K 8D1 HS TaxID=3142385 RepID=UPI0039A307CD